MIPAMAALPSLREWLGEEPFGLTLCAGFFGFYAHAGFVAALEEAGLSPARLSGASAGALVAGFWASGMSAPQMQRRLSELRRPDFWDPGTGAGLLRGQKFQALLRQILPVSTFEQCRAPLGVSVFDVGARRGFVQRRGDLAVSLHASSAFPGLFQPVRIGSRLCLDGAIADRTGLGAMPTGGRVLYLHLPTRSRIRRHFARWRTWPSRAGMATVLALGLPSVGPFRLERGPAAFEAARAGLRDALERRIDPQAPPVLVVGPRS